MCLLLCLNVCFTFWQCPMACRILVPCCCCLVTQSCLTLCNPMDCMTCQIPLPGIPQARILHWVAISCSRRSSCPRDQTNVSCKSPALQADSLPLSHQGSPLNSCPSAVEAQSLKCWTAREVPAYTLDTISVC